MNDIVFTPAALLDLLNQIDELKDLDLGITETIDGKIQLQVGDSIYEITSDDAEVVEVPEEVVDSVEEINEDAYRELVESDSFEESEETIESGLIKEAIKSLLLGGAIKLIKKLM